MGVKDLAKLVCSGKNTQNKINAARLHPLTADRHCAVDSSFILHAAVRSVNDVDLLYQLALCVNDSTRPPLPELFVKVIETKFLEHFEFVRKILGAIPVYIFDGLESPAKAPTTTARRESRAKNYTEGISAYRSGDKVTAKKCLANAVPRTPEMTRVAMELCASNHVCWQSVQHTVSTIIL